MAVEGIYTLETWGFAWVVLILLGLIVATETYFRFFRKQNRGIPLWIYGVSLIVALASLPIFKSTETKIVGEIEQSLSAFAPAYGIALTQMGLEKITAETSPENPLYLKLIEVQKLWLGQNKNIADIYTFGRNKEGQNVLLVDSETDYDHDGKYDDDRESRTDIGEIYEEEDPELDDAFDKGIVSFTPEAVTDKWGTWLSAYYPVKNAKGSADHVVGVDFPAEWFFAELREGRQQVFFGVISLFTLIFGFAIHSRLETSSFQKQLELQNQLSTSLEKNISSAKLAGIGELASNIAHEINNPLAAIEGRIFLIGKKLEEDKIDKVWLKEQTQKISSMVFRASKIIHGLKTLARDSSMDPYEPYPVTKLAEEALEICRQKFALGAVTLKTIFPEDKILLKCRPAELTQVLINLVNNSYDAVEGSPEAWVKVEMLSSSNEIFEIKITDSGQGIPKEISNKILTPFFTTKPVGRGTGLGLNISAKIISEHGGRLYYNDKNPNTEFVLEFPKNLIIIESNLPKAA